MDQEKKEKITSIIINGTVIIVLIIICVIGFISFNKDENSANGNINSMLETNNKNNSEYETGEYKTN